MKATFRMPEMTAKTVWYGSYGGHYNCLVLFKTKPQLVDNGSNRHGPSVDLWEESNKNNICGSMWPDEFEELTGLKIDPESIEITKLYELELTAPWTKDGDLWGYANNADGWV